MNSVDLIAPIVTGVGVASFAAIFTIMYNTYATSAVADYESGQCDVELIDETILENIQSAKTFRKVMKIVKRVLLGIVLAVLVPSLLISVYSKVADGIAMVNGYGVIAVASGSMSEKNEANPYLENLNNQFDTYDMIVLEKVESPADLQLYDVIAFVNDKGVNIIHRIVGVKNTADGLRYVTRGDSNNMDDEYNPSFDDVLGEYTDMHIPLAGVFVMFLQSFSGIITVVAIIYCLIMIEIVRGKIEGAREDRLAFLQESIDFKTEMNPDHTVDSAFVETVYFKNYAYTFDKNGFVSKELLPEDPNAQIDTDSNPVPNAEADPDTPAEEKPKTRLQKFGAWLLSKMFVVDDGDDDDNADNNNKKSKKSKKNNNDDDDDDEDIVLTLKNNRPDNKKASKGNPEGTDDGED